MTLTADFERRLVENIEPIRQFFLAQGLYHALELGVFTTLGENPGLDQWSLADKLSLDPGRLPGLLRFLQNEGYVVNDDGWRLTAKGAGLPVFAPWYQMLVGGYAPTMLQLGDTMRPGAPWATRDTKQVGIGSCGISRYDAGPLVEKLLEAAPGIATLVDLGCGDAGFLADILSARPALRGVGVEPHYPSVQAAKALRAERGLGDRLDLMNGPASEVSTLKFPHQGRGVCFLTAFVLQEMLQQEGEAAVEKLLSTTFAAYPEASWLVVEMDHRPGAPIMQHGLALAFYNPYFLIHTITEQRLESREWWNEMFSRAGLTVLDVAAPDQRADTAGIQFGVLLSRSGPAA